MKSLSSYIIQCTGEVPSARFCHSGTRIGKDKIVIFGGCDNSKDLQDLYLLDLSMKY